MPNSMTRCWASRIIFMCEQLMIDLCYRLALALRRVAVDGNKFSFTVSLRLVLI